MIVILAVPLPVLTICLWRAADVLFGPPQDALSLEAAAALDKRDQVSALYKRMKTLDNQLYTLSKSALAGGCSGAGSATRSAHCTE